MKRSNRMATTWPAVCCLLCGALLAAQDVPATTPEPGQIQIIEALHVPELEAGFHLLYELKPKEARAQFEAWGKSNPEDPLASAAQAAAYLLCAEHVRQLGGESPLPT